ncbi:MAG: hypothetical protein A4E28_01566 [Methanocella sp. PtaU1.Bin125]|nr:MAG: hypothetical protein A4E28_01566 [Methanocella sp. PtaU1.Bin125]
MIAFTRGQARLSLCIALAGLLAVAAVAPAAEAKYNFDGFPLALAAQGQVQGRVLTFETLGLANPPLTCHFTLPGDVAWARAYVGVWGSAPDYQGWAQLQVNDETPDRTPLLGREDTQEDVYVAGYGVYWLAYDATSLLRKGENTVSINTSWRDPESRIDGRVYGIVVVAAVKEPGGPLTTYRVAEGNVNLHGYGWTEGANPTVLDETSLSFGPLPAGGRASLTTVEIATARGQPDYLLLNGRALGGSAADDIGDERSFNAAGATGIDSRYVDMETFDVTSLAGSDNVLTFLRGKDLDGDGDILTTGDRPEGEDYIHPVLAILAVESSGGAAAGHDLAVRDVTISDAYVGTNGTISATLLNFGPAVKSPAQVTFGVDGRTIATQQVAVEASGVQRVSAPWAATAGSHVVEVAAHLGGDIDAANDMATKTVTVGGLPDLVLTMGAPVGPASSPSPQSGTPYALLAAVAGVAIAAGLVVRRPPGKRHALAVLLATALALAPASLPAASMATARADTGASLLPVTITNEGGSDAPAFDLAVFVDGQRTVVQGIDSMEAGNVTRLEIPLYVAPGKHHVRAVADAGGTVREASESNNMAEADYDFR